MWFSVFGFLPSFLAFSPSVLVYRIPSVKPLPLRFFVQALAVMLLRSRNCRKLLAWITVRCPFLSSVPRWPFSDLTRFFFSRA